jgi:hypothetical protein
MRLIHSVLQNRASGPLSRLWSPVQAEVLQSNSSTLIISLVVRLNDVLETEAVKLRTVFLNG